MNLYVIECEWREAEEKKTGGKKNKKDSLYAFFLHSTMCGDSLVITRFEFDVPSLVPSSSDSSELSSLSSPSSDGIGRRESYSNFVVSIFRELIMPSLNVSLAIDNAAIANRIVKNSLKFIFARTFRNFTHNLFIQIQVFRNFLTHFHNQLNLLNFPNLISFSLNFLVFL